MKTLTAPALAELQTQFGTEPINIVAIDWYGAGNYYLYADKTIADNAEARILSLSTVETTLSLKTTQSTTVSVELDDTDGVLKTTFNETNPQKKPCIVYQYFGDIGITNKFVIFKGVIDGPITWTEGERKVTLTIESLVEEMETSVSLEETKIDYPTNDSAGQAWPLVFGDVIHVPATRLVQYPEAKISEPFCLVNTTLYDRLNSLTKAYQQQQQVMGYWRLVLQGTNVPWLNATTLLEEYILVMKREDAALVTINALKAKIKEAQDLKKLPRKKNAAEQKKINNIPAWKVDLVQASAILKQVRADKEILESRISGAEFYKDLRNKAAKNIALGYNGLANIYTLYAETANELCRELDCSKTELTTENGKAFTQDTILSLIINRVRFRGSFSENYLTIHSDMLPRYEDILLGERQSVTNECGDVDDLKGIDLFWTQTKYSLVGMYLLVKKVGEDRNHVIKVVEQDGLKYRFELKRYGDYNQSAAYGNNLVWSEPTLPWYDSKLRTLKDNELTLSPGNIELWQDLTPATKALLGTTLPNNHETIVLSKLKNIALQDVASLSVIPKVPGPREVFTIIGPDIAEIVEASAFPLKHWFDGTVLLEEYPEKLNWTIKEGDIVKEADNSADIFVANILPSTVKAIYAYQTVGNKRSLNKLPTSYYVKNEAEALKDEDGNTKLTITSIKVEPPLEELEGEGWENQIYVTLNSSVGSDIVDVFKHLIDTYTDKSYDSTTFTDVQTKLANYPVNFALLERRNILELLTDIAWQARCAIYLSNDIFYLKYLAERPTEIRTLTEDDILEGSMNVTQDDLSSVITKITAEWHKNYSPDGTRKVVLRHNVNLYGLKEQTSTFYIYNTEDLVLKSATFWLIRLANLWKRLNVNMPMEQMDLDLFDPVKLGFSDTYIANTDVISELQELKYDSTTNSVLADFWLPVKAGTMEEYLFAWPATAAENDKFPTDIEIIRGNAGGSGIGKDIVTKVTVE